LKALFQREANLHLPYQLRDNRLLNQNSWKYRNKSVLINGMEIYYITDYFLFTFFASFGVLQIALGNKNSKRFIIGIVLVIFSYFWFFSVTDRDVPTIVEGAQLFVVFAIGAMVAIFITKNFFILTKKR